MIKNEDAIYKLLAYTGNLEKIRRENKEETLADIVLQQGGHTFDTFYQNILLEDMKKPPREIDESKLIPKINRKDNKLIKGGE